MRTQPPPFLLILLTTTLWTVAGCGPSVTTDPDILARLPEQVDYNFHVKPILSDRCYKCHGPDDNARKAGLRLDTQEGALAASRDDASRFIIIPGKPQASQLIRHITATDPKTRMPPPESNLSLTDGEIAILRRWIEQGAAWKPHWAFITPEKPDRPPISNTDWPRNGIDPFVLSRMGQAGLTPSPETTKEKLIRRVTFDLTGLPPTFDEIDAFLADESPDAYDKVVDRLLASPHYGERMASIWLDVARYADTHGYQDDRPRTMWPWRDWVVRAFNDNLSYDQFVTWQLAGDLLPEATYAQKLATGFNRNHAITQEGGVVPEEYLTEYVADRTNTTATAFLGLTMECARCHDHKFDPILQRDYYQLFAFFNTVEERAQISYFDLAPTPAIPMQDSLLEAQIAHTNQAIDAEEATQHRQETRIDDAFAAWMADSLGSINLDEKLQHGLLSYHRLDILNELTTPDDANPATPGKANTGLEGELDTLRLVPGKNGNAFQFDGINFLNLGDDGDFEWYSRFSFGSWINPPSERRTKDAGLFSKRNGEQKRGGYDLILTPKNRLSARLIHDNQHYVQVTTTRAVPADAWTHVFVTHDGSGRAAGFTLYINGEAQRVTVQEDRLDRNSILNGNDFLAGNWTPRMKIRGDIYGFEGGAIDDVRIYNRALSPLEVRHLAGNKTPLPLTPQPPLYAYYLRHHNPAYRQRAVQLDSLRRSYRVLPSVMIMEEMETPRPTFVLARGAYDAPVDSVGPGTPATVLAFPQDYPRNRLGLAQWLVHAQNPLTARVAVNRFWQMYFGEGLVHTPEDFGNQGALPTHPQLLDWLAVTFVESGWDIKAMQRLIVTSATYRQSAALTPDLLARDPDNSYLARGPHERLSAEMMRDNALAVSGLLVRTVGGPPVRPYQPTGVWKALANQIGENKYRPGRGAELYRRSLYTYWKRTIPPPSMLTFDAAERAVCTVERQATSTPLQSLILLNDPQYVEAARVLAETLLTGDGLDPAARITLAFRALTSRTPNTSEIATLQSLHTEQTDHFRQHPDRAEALINVGASRPNATLDPVELAALTVVTNTVLNLDEAKFR